MTTFTIVTVILGFLLAVALVSNFNLSSKLKKQKEHNRDIIDLKNRIVESMNKNYKETKDTYDKDYEKLLKNINVLKEKVKERDLIISNLHKEIKSKDTVIEEMIDEMNVSEKIDTTFKLNLKNLFVVNKGNTSYKKGRVILKVEDGRIVESYIEIYNKDRQKGEPLFNKKEVVLHYTM